MEVTQRNSLYSYLNKQKCHLFFTNVDSRRAEVLFGGRRLVPLRGGRMWGEGYEGEYGANIVCICM
jgi:hypothetical protein